VREAPLPPGIPIEQASFVACVATILELDVDALPPPRPDEDPATGWIISRWLGGLGLGLAPVASPATFAWAGPWLARVRPPGSPLLRSVVMFGVPSGVVWDPAGGGQTVESSWIEDGFLIAAGDISLGRPELPSAPAGAGTVEAICVAPSAGARPQLLERVRALAGRGLEGDRHVVGRGTFPSGPSGSALTLIEAEVCESFDPPLDPAVHRRNVVTRRIDLTALVGHEFTIGGVRCRGMRLCEPCTVLQRYAARPVLRALVHRGGLRADILEDGTIVAGDAVRAVS
jgi:MOSC domain